MRRPQQSRSEQSAERMLDAAAALLEDGGLAAVTVAAVADRAGTSNGSLYHRFGDRAGLVRALHERSFTAMLEETAAAFRNADALTDDEEAARHLAEAALAIFSRHRAALRAFLVEVADDPAVEARNAEVTASIRAVVVDWLVRHFGASPAGAEDAFALLYALGASQALVGPTTMTPGAVATAVLALSRR